MKLEMDAKALLALCARAVSVLPRKEVMPALGFVKLVLEDGRLCVTGNGLERWLRATAEVGADGAGEVCLPGHKLVGALKEFAGERVTLTHKAKSGFATVEAGRASFKLPVLPLEDFCEVRKAEGERLALPAGQLRALLAGCKSAQHTDEQRFLLCGISLTRKAEEAGLRSYASNGRAMHKVALPMDGLPEGEVAAIVPTAAVALLLDALDSVAADAEAVLVLSATSLLLELEGVHLCSALVQGNLVNFEHVTSGIGADRDWYRVEVKGLAAVISRAALLVPVNGGLKPIGLTGTEAGLEIHADGESGAAYDDLYAVEGGVTGGGKFSAGYILAALADAPAGHVELSFGEELSPLCLRDTQHGWLAVIMGMRG